MTIIIDGSMIRVHALNKICRIAAVHENDVFVVEEKPSDTDDAIETLQLMIKHEEAKPLSERAKVSFSQLLAKQKSWYKINVLTLSVVPTGEVPQSDVEASGCSGFISRCLDPKVEGQELQKGVRMYNQPVTVKRNFATGGVLISCDEKSCSMELLVREVDFFEPILKQSS